MPVSTPKSPIVTTMKHPVSEEPKVEITLSRPAYRLGGTVVGSIRVYHHTPLDKNNCQATTTTTTADSAETSSSAETAVPASSSLSASAAEQQPTKTTHPTTQQSQQHASLLLRQSIQSLQLSVMGRCRLDARWHNVKEIKKNLVASQQQQQRLSSLENQSEKQNPLPLMLQQQQLPQCSDTNNASFVFWATQPIELMDLPEQQQNRWDDVVRPKPIQLQDTSSSSDTVNESNQQQQQQQTTSSILINEQQPQQQQLAFTFRTEIPHTLPHSMVATSCRYTYDVVVWMTQKNDKSPDNNGGTWTLLPLPVLTADPDRNSTADDDATDSRTIRTLTSTPAISNTCQVMAHSAGLPSYLTSVELHRPRGQLTVHRSGACWYRHLQRPQAIIMTTNTSNHHHHHTAQPFQSLRVADPFGRPVCVLTLMGGGPTSPLHPGSRMTLKIEFPIQNHNTHHHHHAGGSDDHPNTTTDGSNDHWVPCYLVSACLQGEEWVHRPSNNHNNNHTTFSTKAAVAVATPAVKVRARHHLFDTAYEYVDPDCTERVCLHLQLPLDAPCSLETDLVSIQIQCLIDISVAKNNHQKSSSSSSSASSHPKSYQNLRLQIPCTVLHSLAAYERRACSDDDQDAADKQQQQQCVRDVMAYVFCCPPEENDNDNNNEIPQQEEETECTTTTTPLFETLDVSDDLKILSLSMVERIQLGPKQLQLQQQQSV